MRFILLLFIGFVACQASGAEPKPAAIPQLPSGDEFTKLRTAFAASDGFHPMWGVDDGRDAIMEAVKAKDDAKIVELSKPWLEKVPVDADVHYARAQALKRLGDWAGASYHWHCFYGLIHSIASSGDGKTPKTAFKVISVAEEYYLLDEIRAEIIEQTLVDSCDKMRVKLRDGTEVTMYFDVSIPSAFTARLFKPQK